MSELADAIAKRHRTEAGQPPTPPTSPGADDQERDGKIRPPAPSGALADALADRYHRDRNRPDKEQPR